MTVENYYAKVHNHVEEIDSDSFGISFQLRFLLLPNCRTNDVITNASLSGAGDTLLPNTASVTNVQPQLSNGNSTNMVCLHSRLIETFLVLI
jgi:hypothetical protein